MKVLNELAQWGAIGLIILLLLSFDFDFLKESPKRISTLEAQITEQRSKINSLEEEIVDVNNKLQSVATISDLKELQEASTNEVVQPGGVAIESQKEAAPEVDSGFESLASYYSKNQAQVISGVVVFLGMLLFLIFRKIKAKVKFQEKAVVTTLKPVPTDKSESRECA